MLLAAAVATTLAAADTSLSGKWQVHSSAGGNDNDQSCVFVQKDSAPTHRQDRISEEWDFEGKGDFPVPQPLTKAKSHAAGTRLTFTTTYSFTQPGTCFPTLRATSQRQGDV